MIYIYIISMIEWIWVTNSAFFNHPLTGTGWDIRAGAPTSFEIQGL